MQKTVSARSHSRSNTNNPTSPKTPLITLETPTSQSLKQRIETDPSPRNAKNKPTPKGSDSVGSRLFSSKNKEAAVSASIELKRVTEVPAKTNDKSKKLSLKIIDEGLIAEPPQAEARTPTGKKTPKNGNKFIYAYKTIISLNNDKTKLIQNTSQVSTVEDSYKKQNSISDNLNSPPSGSKTPKAEKAKYASKTKCDSSAERSIERVNPKQDQSTISTKTTATNKSISLVKPSKNATFFSTKNSQPTSQNKLFEDVDVPESPRESAKINETKHTIVSRPVKKDIKKNRSQTEFSLDSAILRRETPETSLFTPKSNALVANHPKTPNGGKLLKTTSQTETSLKNILKANQNRDLMKDTPLASSSRSRAITEVSVDRRKENNPEEVDPKSVKKTGLYKAVHTKILKDSSNKSMSNISMSETGSQFGSPRLTAKEKQVQKQRLDTQESEENQTQPSKSKARVETHVRRLTSPNRPAENILNNLKLGKMKSEKGAEIIVNEASPKGKIGPTITTPNSNSSRGFLSKNNPTKEIKEEKKDTKEKATVQKKSTKRPSMRVSTLPDAPYEKTSIQPSKNSDFHFEMTYFKPIEDSKLDEFIQNISEQKSNNSSSKYLSSPREEKTKSKKKSISEINTSVTALPKDGKETPKESLFKPKTPVHHSVQDKKALVSISTNASAKKVATKDSSKEEKKKIQKSASPSRINSISFTKNGGLVAKLEHKENDKNSSILETYSKLDKLLQELKVNTDNKEDDGDNNSDDSEKGLFNQSDGNNSATSSTSYSMNKSFAKNLRAFHSNA